NVYGRFHVHRLPWNRASDPGHNAVTSCLLEAHRNQPSQGSFADLARAPPLGLEAALLPNYQRRSRGGRPPRPPPPPAPRLPPPPPPPPPARSGFGRASLTVTARPSTVFPFNPSIALAASSSFGISTNAKPRGRPVSRSVAMWTRLTSPKASK